MHILIIEDDRKIADFIGKGLRQAGYFTEHTGDGRLGLTLAESGEFDCAVIDIMLPRLDGLSIIERLRQRKIALPVLILSAKRELDDRVKGLRAGGDDYLTKPFAFVELLARIEALVRRGSQSTETTFLRYADLEMDLLSRCVRRQGKKIVLQPKEFSLLEYLLRNAGRAVSKTMIMERVWNYNFDPNTNVVEARISRLREKIDKEFDPPLIHTVRGIGYLFGIDAE
ncbi:MAG: response regulator transcription factor [Gammaproteobacteria bacterium]|nr:response regulator transcription factor [Gammaproteobacteria bacterium]